MTRDLFIKELLSDKIVMNPIGRIADELSIDEFNEVYILFIEHLLEIAKTDIHNISGYGEFNDNNLTEYTTFQDYIIHTFDTEKEGYWYHWKEMFETTVLKEDYFNMYLNRTLELSKYCEDKRFLVNNSTFFCNIVVDNDGIGLIDWSRAGITDFLLDFVCLDLNKPYLRVPELLYDYSKKHNIIIEDFKERYLCMAYYKGIDTLRWHASIDDLESCESIMRYLDELQDRIMNM